MNLPILTQTHGSDPDALVRAAKRAETILSRTMADELTLESAIAFTNTQRPDSPLANRATEIHSSPDLTPQAALDQITTHFANLGVRCHALSCNQRQWPDGFAEHVTPLGYQPATTQVLLLQNYVAPSRTREDVQIIPARACYRDVGALYGEWANEQHPNDPAGAGQTADCMTDQLDEPRVDAFIARTNDQAAGVSAVLSLGQIGVIRSVYTAPAHRGRGVATTLLAHAIDFCTRAQFAQVILSCSPGSPAMRLFEAIGFRPVAEYVDYTLT